MSAATTQFSSKPDPLPLVPTSSDFWQQRQIQTGSRNSTQTGSTNNWATETDIDAISASVVIPLFWGQVFHTCLCDANLTRRSTLPLPIKLQNGGRILEVVITLRRKTISKLREWDRVDICSIAKLQRVKVLPVLGTVSTSGLYLMVFTVVRQSRRRRKWIGRARNCVISAEITLKCLHSEPCLSVMK